MAENNTLNQLGQTVSIPKSPSDAILETVPNPHHDTNFVVRLTCPEFTSLCPITNQPDFAKFTIDYVPDKKLVESKSLKLFMSSFRNHGAFHEDCTITIGKRLTTATEPRWLRVCGIWYPRGGIPIDIFFQSGPAPEDIFVPETPASIYRGRD
jgi:7-cyano-7-deazaguanine reductase